jgi:hypothetical protein
MPNPIANMNSPFPLTSALSLREREHRMLRHKNSGSAGKLDTVQTILPLPKGEGRGEGERDDRILNRL